MTNAKRLLCAALSLTFLVSVNGCDNNPSAPNKSAYVPSYKQPYTPPDVYRYNNEQTFKQALKSYIDDEGSVYQKGRDKDGIDWNQVSNRQKHYRVNITDFTASRGGELRVYHNVYLDDSSTNKGASDSVTKPIDETKYTGWNKHTIEDVGTIAIPPNMIMADDNYNRDAHNYASDAYPSVTTPKTMTFKQKAPMSVTYAQVIINTFIKKAGSYLKMNNWTLSPTELQQVNEQFKKANENDYRGDDKLISWNGTTVEMVNGCKALKTSYVRQVGTNPPVYVVMYTFHNNDRMHQLTMSYRQKDEKLWQPLYAQVLNSFKITNIR